MKTIINNIKSILNLHSHNQSHGNKKSNVNCNYANNYYGDQLCQKNGNKVND